MGKALPCAGEDPRIMMSSSVRYRLIGAGKEGCWFDDPGAIGVMKGLIISLAAGQWGVFSLPPRC